MNGRGDRETGREPPKRAVIYARVSSKEQEKEGFSIDAQLKLLREYAATNSIVVVEEFVDVETAKQAGRAAFNEIMDLKKREDSFNAILVEKTDRLYRNLRDWVTIDDLDLELHLVKEGAIFSKESRSTEKFMHGIKVLMAKNYVDNLAEETSKGMKEKAAQRIWPSYAPMGYRNVMGPVGKKIIEPDPDTAPSIRRLFQEYATGEFSIRDLAKKARNEGLVFRKSRHAVPTSTVSSILRNPIYAGRFLWAGQTYEGTHEPIISLELWDRVQSTLSGPRAKRQRVTKRTFTFGGLISCGHCGCAVVAEHKKKRYIYYHCTGHRQRCGEPYAREEVIEEQFVARLDDLRFSDDVLAWVRAALVESHADAKRFHEEELKRLRADHDAAQSRLDAMYLDKVDGVIDTQTFERLSGKFRTDQDRYRRALSVQQDASHTYYDDGVKLMELAKDVRRLFSKQSSDEKRKLLGFLVSNCTWANRTLTVEFKQPFDLIAQTTIAARAEAAQEGVDLSISENWLLGQGSNL